MLLRHARQTRAGSAARIGGVVFLFILKGDMQTMGERQQCSKSSVFILGIQCCFMLILTYLWLELQYRNQRPRLTRKVTAIQHAFHTPVNDHLHPMLSTSEHYVDQDFATGVERLTDISFHLWNTEDWALWQAIVLSLQQDWNHHLCTHCQKRLILFCSMSSCPLVLVSSSELQRPRLYLYDDIW